MFDQGPATHAPSPLSFVIVGAGFAGIGMAIALRKQGIEDFVLVEKARDVGGVWRENRYPGAACDVPSHLYSFSFEPNPAWSHVFSPQAEIEAYLQHCARKYDLYRHIRFASEVSTADFDETRQLWRTQLRDGSVLVSRAFISAVGQLSRPILPQIPGLDTFKGRCFHSAQWDPAYTLEDRRVAVIGTGASAIQFVPAIAPQTRQLKVFQRSPAWLKPRPDRPYRAFEKKLFRRVPAIAKLYRLGHYLRYESRALAFTRFRSLMRPAIGWPFQRMLKRDIADPQLREKLVPDYPIGCKRILLTSNYLPALARPNVELITQGIRCVTEHGIETDDGRSHDVDAIIYGTGFAATEFLAPMQIRGRGALDLNAVWKQGAEAYLGITVPGFPNLFLLYGPNTNLGHNSIVYMLESQIAHVMRCWRALQARGAETIEVHDPAYRRYNGRVQQHLRRTVWNGCKSWYVDAQGHNSTNWPGFTLSYRLLTRFASLRAYRFSRRDPSLPAATEVFAADDARERVMAVLMRGVLRSLFRPLIGSPFPPWWQRVVANTLTATMPARLGTQRTRLSLNGVPVERVTLDATAEDAAILYLHGGAFCLGGPHTHRGLVSHLAQSSGCPVVVPDYRLAPEHPHPAALDDVLACYRALRQQGTRVALAGDSAGAGLALELALRLKALGEPQAEALALISPFSDARLSGASIHDNAARDPMLRIGWLRQGIRWYQPPLAPGASLLEQDLDGLPPMLIQVGDQEILYSDSTRLAQRAAQCDVDCALEIHRERWHVFHLQTAYLHSAVSAVQTAAGFLRARLRPAASQAEPVPAVQRSLHR